jgi:type II secretory ATPase GspE/PulE/Tfp pilus assembly ATPase PilB-like protein
MLDPLDPATLADLQFQSGKRVEVIVSTATALQLGMRAAYDGEVLALAKELPGGAGGSEPLVEGLEAIAERDAPIVRIVDLLLRRTVEAGASDLHIEQGVNDLVVRERVDGVLRKVTELPAGARTSLLSRIKVLGDMDISVKRRPQDGGFSFTHGDRALSIRVSTLPVEGGEKAVLRFLDPRSAPANLDALGFSPEDLTRVRSLVRGGRGVLLASGPTGSGKSSTLFGALGEINREEVNVVTLEDPIEYRVKGVNQVQVNPRSGLTFPAALRAVLRQDPDVIMIGEIRDAETAEIAMAAAITGHLVLSTIHTNDAPSGITRLLQMGVAPHLVAGGLAGIIAQRLVRKSCSACGGHPTGCSFCHRGYRGRIGVFQVLTVTEALREAIGQGVEASELRRRAEEGGMGTMVDDARRKVAEGVTSQHEMARVLREDPGEILPCPRCGGGLPAGGQGCPHCGTARRRRCQCGRALRRSWRYCPECLRRAPPSA